MLLCGEGEEKQPTYGPDHQEEALCQWFARVGGGAWNHSSLPTSHNNRDELSSQKPLLLLIKALYIVCDVFDFFFFLFLLLVLIKYQCCFYIVFQLGFIIIFMQVSSPAIFFVLCFFSPHRLFMSNRNPFIFVFLFLVVKLSVGSLFPR